MLKYFKLKTISCIIFRCNDVHFCFNLIANRQLVDEFVDRFASDFFVSTCQAFQQFVSAFNFLSTMIAR